MNDRAEQERAMREAFDAGDLERTATAALAAYSREIYGFLAARLPARSDADETFSMFTENLWSGLSGFAWKCSMRTWCFIIANNAMCHYSASPHRRPGRNIPLSCPGVLSQLAVALRTATATHQRTEVKDSVRRLRDKLDEDDQLLLLLRVDRKLSFREIAVTVLGDADPEARALTREEARLRQAFSRLKTNFRRMAEDEGLLDPRS